MFLTSINYKQALQVTAVAIAIGPTLPTGILAQATTYACAALGIICINAISRFMEEPILTTFDKDELKKSLDKVKDFRSYQWHMKIARVEPEGALRHWEQILLKSRKNEKYYAKYWRPSAPAHVTIFKEIINNLQIAVYCKKQYIEDCFRLKKMNMKLKINENKFNSEIIPSGIARIKRVTDQWLAGYCSQAWITQIKTFEKKAINELISNMISVIPSVNPDNISYAEYKTLKLAKYQKEEMHLSALFPPPIPFPDLALVQNVKLYKIAPRFDTSTIGKLGIENALENIKNFKSYRWLMKIKSVESENELAWWEQEMAKGSCCGQASVLLNVKKEKFSLSNKLNSITIEEVIYKQIIEHLKSGIDARKQHIDLYCDLKKITLEKYKGLKLKEYQEEEMRLGALSSFPNLHSCPIANKFLEDVPVTSYQNHFESSLKVSSIRNEPIRGVIILTEHVMTFQYGPQEYLLYDSSSEENGGLFKYPNKESFFTGMRLMVREYYLQRDFNAEKSTAAFQIYPY